MRRFLSIGLFVLLLAGCCRNGRPLIGITTSLTGSGASSTGENYINAVIRSGGLPVLLPVQTDSTVSGELVSSLDGMIVIGGGAVEPLRYGEEAIPEAGVEVVPRRDTSDFMYVRCAIRSKVPVLAICRGEQVVNVALGGSLWQDLPLQKGVNHRDTSHVIFVSPGSWLHSIMGADTLTVNSFHHQAVKDPAPGIVITAVSADGIVEAYDLAAGSENGPVHAVQFHPEVMARRNPVWLALFREFVRECSGKAR